MRIFRDPTSRWLQRRRWWERWGPLLAMLVPLLVLMIVILELLRLGEDRG